MMSESLLEDRWEKLKPMIARSVLSYNHFLRRASEKWLPLLERDGHFRQLHDSAEKSEKDSMAAIGLARYLAKISDKRPREVMGIIRGVCIEGDVRRRNPWVLSLFAEAACSMPTEFGRLLVPKITADNWADVPYAGQTHGHLSKLMLRLADDGHGKESLMLCKMLLSVRLGGPGGLRHHEESGAGSRAGPVLDQYSYEAVLKDYVPRLFQKFPRQVVELLVESLDLVTRLDGKGRGAGNRHTAVPGILTGVSGERCLEPWSSC